MKRITPRTCLWPLTICLCITFALSIGLTYRSDHYCFAGTCGEWLFPLEARLHVVVWNLWISLSIVVLALRAFRPSIRDLLGRPLGIRVAGLEKQLRVSGLLLVVWVLALYGILIGIWWTGLRDYFAMRGEGLPGNNVVAAVAMTGHLADVTMGMVLLPVSRHSALSSFFKLSPSTTFTFHMVQAYVLFGLVLVHGSLYAGWATLYNQNRKMFRNVLPVLNPTYRYDEVWPGSSSSLGIWRASLIFTGSVSSLIMLAMFLTSFPAVRRTHFNLFYFTHLLIILGVIVICLHASTMFYCTAPGLSMWLLDWGMRVFELREKLDSRLCALGNGWFCLTLPVSRKRLSGCACSSPLAHFYIHHSASSFREIHPFTTITHLASQKRCIKHDESVYIQFLFKESTNAVSRVPSLRPARQTGGQWTNKLGSLVDEERPEPLTTDASSDTDSRGVSTGPPRLSFIVTGKDAHTAVRLEGPYFTPADPASYRTAICLVAGTGLSGAIAIAAAYHATRSEPRSEVATPSLVAGTACANPSHKEERWERCIIIWSVRENDYVDMPFFESLRCDGLEFRVHKTGGANSRPDMTQMLRDVCGDDGDDCWCYISGPNGFIAAAEQACDKFRSLTRFAARWD